MAADETAAAGADAVGQSSVPTEKLLEMLADVHERFEAGTMSYEDFESTKADLLSRLPVD